ncbi:MAG: glycosyltransferase, partial [Acidobacteria bacterium]|nr:glycosyltransferase [Acidobacteriota bacterium]
MNLQRKFITAFKIWRESGLPGIRRKISWKKFQFEEKRAFRKWLKNHERLSRQQTGQIEKRIASFERRPLISIILPVYDVEEKWLRICIESVLRQIYAAWELCIADDYSPSSHVRRVLEEYAAADKRIKLTFRTSNGHISAASNSALELATGEFSVLL